MIGMLKSVDSGARVLGPAIGGLVFAHQYVYPAPYRQNLAHKKNCHQGANGTWSSRRVDIVGCGCRHILGYCGSSYTTRVQQQQTGCYLPSVAPLP